MLFTGLYVHESSFPTQTDSFTQRMDEKVTAIKNCLLPLLSSVQDSTPFILGLSGVQGSGKSTLVTKIQSMLIENGYKTAQFSLDDLYLTYADQSALAQRTGNKLWASRGQFGTHDLELAKSVLQQIRENGKIRLPAYDKSKHQGSGDRLPIDSWPEIQGPVDVVIFEGWGLGFQELTKEEILAFIEAAHSKAGEWPKRVTFYTEDELLAVNDALAQYTSTFMGPEHFDAFIMLEAEQTHYVYDWRLQQEHALREAKGSGMTDVEVERFVDRYYTSYELYLPRAILGFLSSRQAGRQINLILNKKREIIRTYVI